MKLTNNTISNFNFERKITKRLINSFEYSITILCSILLGLSAITNNKIYVIILFLFIPFGIFKPTSIIPTYYVSSLSSQYFIIEEGLGINRLFNLAIFLGIVLRIIINRQSIESNWIKYIIYIGITTLISYIFANYQYIKSLTVVGMNLLILFTFSNIRLDNKQIKMLFKNMFIAVLIISITILINAILKPNMISGRLTLSEDLNNNTFSILVAQLSAYIFGYMLYTKDIKIKIISILIGFTNIYLILLSGSRTAFIAVSLGILSIIIIMKFKNKEKLKGLFIIGFIVVVGYVLFIYVSHQYPSLAQRFSLDNIIKSGGTNRLERIIAEIKYIIPENLFFGVGPISLNETIALSNYLELPGSSHNILISMLTQIGIVGSIGYIILIQKIIIKLIKRLRVSSFNSIPLSLILTGIFNGVGEVVYHERFFWSALALGVICITTNNLDYFDNKFNKGV